VRIEVLGLVSVWHDGTLVRLGSMAQRAVLGLLALAGGQVVSRTELSTALWDGQPPRSARNVIQTHVKHLRRLLEPDRRSRARSVLLPNVGDGYALHLPLEDIDLFRFRRLVSDATSAQDAGDLVLATALLRESLRLWRGPVALMDIPNLAVHPRVVAVVEERRAVLARCGEALVAVGAAVEALPLLEEAVADHPLDEAGQARLIRAYHAAGRRAQAFDTYHRSRRLLVDELGVDPGPELVAAHAALLREDRLREDSRGAVRKHRFGGDRALFRRGDVGQGVDHLEQALALFREFGERANEARSFNGAGEAWHSIGRLDQAQAHHRSALEIATEIGDRYEQARAHIGLARAHPAGDGSAPAHGHWAEALALYAELGIPEPSANLSRFADMAVRGGSRPPDRL
jgi:DNA-binding SARP family transcriptional activator